MKAISIALTNSAYAEASRRSQEQHLDVATFCSSMLMEQLTPPGNAVPQSVLLPKPLEESEGTSGLGDFDLERDFEGFPQRSIDFAKVFIAEAYRVEPGIKVRKYMRSTIDIRPNFVRIEAVLSRKQGIRVSLYGTPDKFKDRPEILVPGMGSYSRAVIESDSQLAEMLPMIKQAHQLKLGR